MTRLRARTELALCCNAYDDLREQACKALGIEMDQFEQRLKPLLGVAANPEPHNIYHIYTHVWHPCLAALDDRQLAECWELSEYLLLPDTSLTEEAAQRRVLIPPRCGIIEHGTGVFQENKHLSSRQAALVNDYLQRFIDTLHRSTVSCGGEPHDFAVRIAAGLDKPFDRREIRQCSQWGCIKMLYSLETYFIVNMRVELRAAAERGSQKHILAWLDSAEVQVIVDKWLGAKNWSDAWSLTVPKPPDYDAWLR